MGKIALFCDEGTSPPVGACTSLHISITAGRYPPVDIILKRCANVNLTSSYSLTIIRVAEYDDAKEVLDTCSIPREVLLAEKADIYEQLAQVNQHIRQERWKLKQCKEISETAAIMQKDIDHIEQQPQRTANTRQR